MKQTHKNSEVYLESDSCNGKGQIKQYSFETLMQESSIEINLQEKSIFETQGQKLPFPLHEGGCDSTSLDPFTYSGDSRENFFVFKKFSQDAKMIKHDN